MLYLHIHWFSIKTALHQKYKICMKIITTYVLRCNSRNVLSTVLQASLLNTNYEYIGNNITNQYYQPVANSSLKNF